MALSAPRNTLARSGDVLALAVAANAVIHQGGIVAVNAAGFAVPGQAAAGLAVMGRARTSATGGAANGAVTVEVEPGVYAYASAGGADAVTRARLGKAVYLVDDETVAATDGAGARSLAGVVVDVDAMGVWVKIAPGAVQPPLGAETRALAVVIPTLQGSGVTRLVSPFAGTLTRLQSVIAGALATGDATITASINGTAVTGGVLTIAQAGSAAGDADAATPSAANAVAVGDVIALTVGGTNSNAVAATVTLTFTV
jgi:fermentation-respiration switch protein FrsA (DUF1100 family)